MSKRYTIIFLLLATASLKAQDPLFSQFYAAPLQLNPAFTGSAFAPRLGINYRHQWPGFENAYRTYAAYYEQNLERLNSGIGFHIEGDNAGNGIYKTTRFSALYSYQLRLSDGVALQFPEAQWAVTPGQSAVLYDGEVCLGGGVIAAVD